MSLAPPEPSRGLRLRPSRLLWDLWDPVELLWDRAAPPWERSEAWRASSSLTRCWSLHVITRYCQFCPCKVNC